MTEKIKQTAGRDSKQGGENRPVSLWTNTAFSAIIKSTGGHLP